MSLDLMLSAVVPCYNEADVLVELHRRLSQVCRNCATDSYEIILVNDGSTDSSWDLITDLADHDSHVVGVNLARNHGHQLALTAGLSLCRGARILIIDADLQDPPELLPDMMKLMDAGSDVVYGQRIHREGETWFKRTTAAMFYRLLFRLSDVPIPKDTGDFRLMRREVLDVLKTMPEQHRFVRGMVSWIGFNQVALKYRRNSRLSGNTKYPLRKMIKFSIDALTGFSIMPLRLSIYIAFFFIIIAFVLAIYVIYSLIALNAVQGWASTLLAFLVFSSVQLLALGIIGEYVGRTYVEAKRRPLFLIREVYTQRHSAQHCSAEQLTSPWMVDRVYTHGAGR